MRDFNSLQSLGQMGKSSLVHPKKTSLSSWHKLFPEKSQLPACSNADKKLGKLPEKLLFATQLVEYLEYTEVDVLYLPRNSDIKCRVEVIVG